MKLLGDVKMLKRDTFYNWVEEFVQYGKDIGVFSINVKIDYVHEEIMFSEYIRYSIIDLELYYLNNDDYDFVLLEMFKN